MAKIQNNAAPVLKAKRNKTPAQVEKAARNIIAAQQRFRDLQANQEAVKQARAQGFVGSDSQILGDLANRVANDEAALWLKRVFAVRGFGGTIQRWLASRIDLEAVEVKALVVRFLQRPQNEDIKAAVVDEAFGGFTDLIAA